MVSGQFVNRARDRRSNALAAWREATIMVCSIYFASEELTESEDNSVKRYDEICHLEEIFNSELLAVGL